MTIEGKKDASFEYGMKYEDNLNHFVSNLCLQIHFKCSSTVDKPMWCSYCQEDINETL